jgi:hypothetical protein
MNIFTNHWDLIKESHVIKQGRNALRLYQLDDKSKSIYWIG